MDTPETPAARSMDRRHVWIAGAIAALAWIVVLVFREPAAAIADLYPDALPPHPFLLPGHTLRLYLMLPATVTAMVLALLAPGALLVLAFGATCDIADFALKSFGASFAIHWLVHAAGVLAGLAWTPAGFIAAGIALSGLAWAVLLARVGRARAGSWPVATRADRRRAGWFVAIPALAVVALLPLIFWQDFTADGLEAFVIGRSLNDHVMPRFPNPSGLMGLGIGMSAMAYPVYWFSLLLGPLEAAARLPVALNLPLLFLALVALIEHRSPRGLRPLEELALVCVLAAFVVTLGFNGSYEPYAADLSAPTGFESLTVLAMASALLYLWRGETTAFVAFTVLAYLARPTGLLLVLLIGLGSLALGAAERRAWLRRSGIALLACIATYVLYEKIFVARSGTGAGYPSASILGRLQYLSFLDLRRFLFLVVPCGFLPALALPALRRQDPLARSLTIICVAYFGFFYVQAFVALHHFAPLMILPAVVFWRIVLHGADRAWPAPAALAGALLGTALALPPRYEVFRAARPVGRQLAFEAGDAFGTWAQYREAYERRRVVDVLFGADLVKEKPAEVLSLAPDVLIWYAHRFRPDPETANYVVRRETAAPPRGLTRIAAAEGLAMFVRDTAAWQAARRAPPRTDFRSPLFAIPSETLFWFRGVPAGNYDVNLGSLPLLWRLF
jgi:hypothetical protein